MTLLATIIVLGVLIFVHELGHFLAAKSVDIRVERFSIGLGRRVWGFQRGETEYVLAAIPLGGYVKMGGMDDEVMEQVEGGPSPEPRAPSPRDFDAKPLWARAWVISAGVLMNFAFAFLAYAFVAAAWGDSHLDTRRLGEVAVDRLPTSAQALADLPVGSEIVQVGQESVEYWSDVGQAILDAPAGPLTIRTENPATEVAITLTDDSDERLRVASSLSYWLPAQVGPIEPGSPAEEARLRMDDLVLSVEGVPVRTWNDLVREIRARPGLRTEFVVSRNGQELVRPVTPASARETDPETGESREFGRVGINAPAQALEVSYRPVPVGEALVIGWDRTVFITGMIVDFVRQLFTGGISPRSVGSIVTIGALSGEAAERGLAPFLEFMAMFSVNLAVLNLLPIPILDGGHLLFLLVEAVRGKALSIETRMRLSQLGFVVILGLMVLALSNDFRNVVQGFLSR